MFPRARWLICLACLGCHAMPRARQEIAPPAQSIAAAPSAGVQPAQAAPNHLTLAAASLANGDDDGAGVHLTRFVANHPEHPNARFFLAELLFQRGRHAEAREHYERTIVACQDEARLDLRHLLHCHGRLLAAAEALDDEYEILLQRGIGLALSARLRAELGDPKGEMPVEALLFRAAGCLAAAHRLRPDQARPCWYLHTVWRQLAQAQPAELWLRRAQGAASFSYLTAVEQRELYLAARGKIG